MTLLINEDEVKHVMTMEDYIEAVEDAFCQYGKGLSLRKSVYPQFRIEGKGERWGSPKTKGIYMGMAYLEGSGLLVLRHLIRLGNRNEGLYHLMDKKGNTLAIIKAAMKHDSHPSGERVGADGAVAAKYLSRKDSRVAGIIGTGKQGKIQLRYLCKVRPIEKAFAHSGRRKDVTYAKEMSRELGIDVIASDSIERVVKNADILVTATRAWEPLVRGEWVSKGVHINGIGADDPEKVELDVATLKKTDKIVIDDEWCFQTAELRLPIKQGILKKTDIYGNIGEVVAGVKPARESPSEVTFYKSTGMIIYYVTIMAKIYERTKKLGLGVETSSIL